MVVRGNRVIFQNFRDSLTDRDETTGVYKLYTEYYSDNETKFAEIALTEFSEDTENYLKATYTRYSTSGDVLETKTFDLVYVGRGLVDIDNAVINNDFYSNDKLESVLNYMVNIAGMEAIAAAQATGLSTLEGNVNSIINGNLEVPKQFGMSLDVFVDVTESREITINDFGKILKCDGDDAITLTIPAEPVEDGFGNSALFFEYMKTGAVDVTLAGAEGVSFVQATPGTLVQAETWTRVRVMRVAENTWLIEGALSSS